ncbi:NUDIX hydrolase [Methylobacterium thuringiense]|uniref:RNA pyrophosphohydrolase n=1 Tax=Methylobacterium thuringiense TaxID=1003091 RepID=A0ABQ4TK21_9HYPH|nr:NUDIX domain-containing protein [Methylobacterium thuringiense]GJE54948.1 RNA pyrophosphohydrolase [Methylobacterium thuringiense]
MTSELRTTSEPLTIRHIARALVFDPANRLLLIEYEAVRPAPANPEAKNFWFMPGGGLEPGETHEEACRRELGEEIGVHDAAIGPQVALCDGPFHLFDKSRDARERYFVVRLPDDRIDTHMLAETEDNPVIGTRWWPLDELATTDARIEPAGLTDLACRIARGEVPETPETLMWRGA